MVSGLEVYPVKSLLDVIHFVNSGNGVAPGKVDGDTLLGEAQHYAVDFKDVRGQQTAKRALEIACAGGHNILMIGPPDAGSDVLGLGVWIYNGRQLSIVLLEQSPHVAPLSVQLTKA